MTGLWTLTLLLWAQAAPGPLTGGARERFWGSPEDAPAEKLLATEERLEGRHYMTCDEWTIQLLEPHARDLGGAYVGVGSDQAYLFLGWMRAELGWLVDYDPLVVQQHFVYLAFFEVSETPRDFLDWWDMERRRDAIRLLKERYADHPLKQKILNVYRYYHNHPDYRLDRLIGRLRRAEVRSYLTDQGDYDHVRGMIRAGRVRPLLGNLLGGVGFRGIGDAARALGVAVRGVYLSNAESYWRYTDAFRANLRALPYDDKSLVFRTIAAKRTNGDYRYYVQTAASFLAYLAEPWVNRVRQVVPVPALKSDKEIPLHVVDTPPVRDVE
jgi:hypothetical protein